MLGWRVRLERARARGPGSFAGFHWPAANIVDAGGGINGAGCGCQFALADGEPDINPGDLPKEQFLPPEYSTTRSELEVTIQSGSGPVTEDFDLQ